MKNYIIQKGKNKYSPFAGIKLISDLIDKLNIKEKINLSFPLPSSNRAYNPYIYVKSIILGLLLGADCIMDIDNIKQDIKSVKWDLSLRKLPSGSFDGNALWANIALLAYNITKLFSVITKINKSLKSLRYLLFSAVGAIVRHGNRKILKLFVNDDKYNLFLYLKECLIT